MTTHNQISSEFKWAQRALHLARDRLRKALQARQVIFEESPCSVGKLIRVQWDVRTRDVAAIVRFWDYRSAFATLNHVFDKNYCEFDTTNDYNRHVCINNELDLTVWPLDEMIETHLQYLTMVRRLATSPTNCFRDADSNLIDIATDEAEPPSSVTMVIEAYDLLPLSHKEALWLRRQQGNFQARLQRELSSRLEILNYGHYLGGPFIRDSYSPWLPSIQVSYKESNSNSNLTEPAPTHYHGPDKLLYFGSVSVSQAGGRP